MAETILPDGLLLGRAHLPDRAWPAVVTVREGRVFDITARRAPTVRDVCELDDPVAHVREARGRDVGPVAEFIEASWAGTRSCHTRHLLSPVDLQAIKASGVTFVASLLERVIEEQALGDADRAEALREDIVAVIGAGLDTLVPGSPTALRVKEALMRRGLWSQYLEVGIGPDAEIFTKAQPMSSVGYGADVGLHPMSQWNNPEPEIALVVSSRGAIVGATLGNDVNLRDVEGRSALLLGRAKDNNASAALGPMIRLFDEGFALADIEAAELSLAIEGEDGFRLSNFASMRAISRRPADLVAATIGRHHQYPDGLVLYLGTMLVPAADRGAAGKGFTHLGGDLVSIASPVLGTLANRVRLSTECPPWTYGTSALMRDLAAGGLV